MPLPSLMRGLGSEKWLIQQVPGATCKDSHHLMHMSVYARPDSTKAGNESQQSERLRLKKVILSRGRV